MTRHSYASHLVQNGAPLAVVASLLGQTVLQVTAKYAHLAPSTLREAVQVLGRPGECRWCWGPLGGYAGREDEPGYRFRGPFCPSSMRLTLLDGALSRR